VLSVFARRRQLSMRSQTTDRLLAKFGADDSRPHSVVIYDQLTLCQRHRQQHLNNQHQHHTTSLGAFPLLLQPHQHLAASVSTLPTPCRPSPADIVLVPRPLHCPAGVPGNPVTSPMTSFALECDDCGNANAGDACLAEATEI